MGRAVMAYTIEQPDSGSSSKYTIEPPQTSAPKKQSAAGTLIDSFADVPKEIMKEGGEALGNLKADASRPVNMTSIKGAGDYAANQGRIATDALGLLGAPLTGALTSALGRPIETMTKGRVPREVTGGIASLAIPGVDALVAANDVSKLAKAANISEAAAKKFIAARKAETAGSAAAAKRAAARPELHENVKALEKLNIDPSLAVASTSRATRGATNALGQNIFMGPMVRKAVSRTATGFKTALDQAVEKNGGSVSDAAAGEKIKGGVERFSKTSPAVKQAIASMSPTTRIAAGDAARSITARTMGFGNKAENLYAKAGAMIGNETQPIAASNFHAAVNDVMNEFHDPNLADQFQHSEVKKMADALDSSGGKLTWGDAARLRTKIRETMKADPALRGKVSDTQIDAIYNGLTKDLQTGAGQLGGPKAEKAWKEANGFYRAGMDRINNTLSKYYGPHAEPASVFYDLMRSGQAGSREDLSRLSQVKRSVSPDEWKTLSASVLDHMGRALPGQRTAETDFSFATFLNNFNKLDQRASQSGKAADSGLKLLFEGAHGTDHAETVKNLAKVASEMKELQKFHNFSRSGEMAGNIATGTGLATAGLNHHPLLAIVPLFTGNAASKLLESPTFVKWLAGIPADASPAVTAQKVKEAQHVISILNGGERAVNPTSPTPEAADGGEAYEVQNP